MPFNAGYDWLLAIICVCVYLQHIVSISYCLHHCCLLVCVPYCAAPGGVVLFHVAAEGGIDGISPALQGNFSIVWLHVTHFFFEVVKAKRQAVAGVQKPSLLQGTMLCDQDLNERGQKWEICYTELLPDKFMIKHTGSS